MLDNRKRLHLRGTNNMAITFVPSTPNAAGTTARLQDPGATAADKKVPVNSPKDLG
jgi:hypothetical protein